MGNYDTYIIGYGDSGYYKVWCLDCAKFRTQAQYPLHRNEASELPLGARCEECGRVIYPPQASIAEAVDELEGRSKFLDEVEEFVDGLFPTPPEAEGSDITWNLDGEQGSVPVQFVEYLSAFDARRRGEE